ncbi:MAG: thymidylate synthase [Candidatus Levyibacteriota bacterium]
MARRKSNGEEERETGVNLFGVMLNLFQNLGLNEISKQIRNDKEGKIMKKTHPEYQYLNLLKDVLENGVKNVDRGTKAVSYSVFGRQCRYDLSKGFPLLTTKKVYWKGVLHELYWFMSGQSNIKYLVDNNVHIWDDYPYKIYNQQINKTTNQQMAKEEFIQKIKDDNKFAKKWGNLPKIYGELWRRWPTRTKRTIDQLKWAIGELREDKYARNAIVNSWNPEYLYKMAEYKDASRFPICHNMYQISLKGGKVYLQLYQRSADLFLGVPFNIASYALLAIIIAQVLKAKPGEFVHTFGDAHIYKNHIEQVKEQLKRKPRPFPKVTIDKGVKEIDDFRVEHVTLENYDPYPVLKGELTVAGGFYEKSKT